MTELKTQVNDQSVASFIDAIEDEKRRKDCQTVLGMMREAMGVEPKMWGDSIVGFGSYHYKGKSGREGEWFVIGFSPRKANLTLYVLHREQDETDHALLEKLGKHTRGKGCLYVKKLDDVDMDVLKELIGRSAADQGKSIIW